MDLQTVSLLAGIALTLLTIAGLVFGWFGKLFAWVRGLSARLRASSPLHHISRQTLILQPHGPRPFWWHMGSSRGQPAMQIIGNLIATNISKYGVLVTSAKMRRPKTTGVAHLPGTKNDLIESRYVTEMSFDFWVIPPVRKKGETLRADIAIVDQFGNEHWLKKVRFEYS